jgi:hypothetical protein
VDASQEAILALHQIAMVGDRSVLDAAITVADGLGALSTAYRAKRGGAKTPAKFLSQADRVNDSLVEFVAVARADLQRHDKDSGRGG